MGVYSEKTQGEASFPIQVHSFAIIIIRASFIILLEPLQILQTLCQIR